MKVYEHSTAHNTHTKEKTEYVTLYEQPRKDRFIFLALDKLDILPYKFKLTKKLVSWIDDLGTKRHQKTCNNDCVDGWQRAVGDTPGEPFPRDDAHAKKMCGYIPWSCMNDLKLYHMSTKNRKMIRTYKEDQRKPA